MEVIGWSFLENIFFFFFGKLLNREVDLTFMGLFLFLACNVGVLLEEGVGRKKEPS